MNSNIYYGKAKINVDGKEYDCENASINIEHVLRDESVLPSEIKDRYMGFKMKVADGDISILDFQIEYKGEIPDE